MKGYRLYGPRKLKLVQIFLGKLKMLEEKGVNTKAVLNYVMGRKKNRKVKTFEHYTTKELSGLISQLKGL